MTRIIAILALFALTHCGRVVGSISPELAEWHRVWHDQVVQQGWPCQPQRWDRPPECDPRETVILDR